MDVKSIYEDWNCVIYQAAHLFISAVMLDILTWRSIENDSGQ